MSARFLIMPAALLAVLALVACSGAAPGQQSPLTGSRQLILVVAENDTVHRAELGIYERSGESWERKDSWPVVLGRNGLAWGRGLHGEGGPVPGEPVKREGDGKSPAGAFTLPLVTGYAPADSVGTRLPYTQATPDLICIDDVRSEFYSLVVSLRETGLDPASLPSHEDMLRNDDLYRLTVTVGHNLPEPVGGAGSCIFLHLWNGPESFTAGCTAMEGSRMEEIVRWLDPRAKPVIVQLTRAGYDRLRTTWGLPELE